MHRADGPQTPYEVYCHNCEATFAIGTRNCVHCGARIGRSPAPLGPDAMAPSPGAPSEPGTEDESPLVSLVRRLSGASLWVLIVLFATLSRLCAEGG